MGRHARGLDIVPIWARFNDSLIRLVDYVPDDRLDWSPQPGLYDFRRILQHIANARDIWLSRMGDGVETPDIEQETVTKPQIQDAYRRTWARLEPVLRDPEMLAGMHGGGRNYAPVTRPLDRVSPAGARHPSPRRHLPLPGAARHRDA